MNTDTETAPSSDPRIAAALDEIGYAYEIDESGSFFVMFNFEGGRTQKVCIASGTDEFMGIELREISSGAIFSEGIFDARTANYLLRDNAKVKFGAWGIEILDNKHYAIFTMKVAAALPPQTLGEIAEVVAYIADQTEERLSGLDEF